MAGQQVFTDIAEIRCRVNDVVEAECGIYGTPEPGEQGQGAEGTAGPGGGAFGGIAK
jgi:hypothetical protein